MPTTVIAAIAAWAAENVIAAFVLKILVSAAISSVLSKKPSGPRNLGQMSRDQQITSRDPAASGRVIYGETRAGGVLVFMHATPVMSNEEVEVQENMYAGPNVGVDFYESFRSDVSAVFRVSEPDDAGYGSVPITKVVGTPGPGQYSVTGGVYSYHEDDWGKLVLVTYKYALPSRVIGKYLHLVIELACHKVSEIGDIYFDDELIPLDGAGNATGRLSGYVYIAKHLGETDQAADAALVAAAPDKWTSAHRLRGRAYIYVRLSKNESLFPNGVPNIRVQIKGKEVYDPRTEVTAWTKNVALCLSDYLTDSVFGLGSVYADEINEEMLIAAANVCDEAVTLAAGGTEPRYTCNGSFLTSDQPKDIIGRLQAAMAGKTVRIGGRWEISAGAWQIPTEIFDEDDLRGPIRVSTLVSRRELFNGVKGVYAGPANGYQPADFPVVTNATYLTEDREERAWLDIELPWTDSAARAQRLSKIELERVRQQITASLPCKLSALRVKPPQVIYLNNTRLGWVLKPFQVVELRLVTVEGDDGAPYRGVDMVVRETAESVFDWNSGEETTVDPAPNTNLPNPFYIAPPGTPTVVEEIYATTGSAGVKSRATVTWGDSVDSQATQYGMEYRVAGATVWEKRPLVRATKDVLDDLAPDTYEFRVRAFNSIGVASVFSQTRTAEIIGLSAPPAALTGFVITKLGGVGYVKWNQHPELDVQINGAVIIRHSSLSTGAVWNDGVQVETFPGGVVTGLVPLMTGTYMAKARDSAGNYSESMVSFVVTEGMITGFTTAGSVVEHPDFDGAKTDVEYDGTLDGIQLDGTALAGSYAFDTVLDLTTVATRRFQAAITAQAYDAGVDFDSSDGLFDDHGMFDGGEVDDCGVVLLARITNDNPAGSPVWGEWFPFFVSDFTCRAAQFRLDFSRIDINHNIVVTELSVTALVPV